jgi:formamidopyrimidine-DNA glycosylase
VLRFNVKRGNVVRLFRFHPNLLFVTTENLMPELPDVQVFKEYLDSTALHQRIREVDVSAGSMVKDTSVRSIKLRLKGQELRSTRRHGKHLFVDVTGGGWLRLHFGMSGDLKYFKDDEQRPKHERLRLDFSNGCHLSYIDVRKFGEIGLVEDVDAFVSERHLGPDALALDLKGFRDVLLGRRGAIKNALMDQAVVAGIGNIYADEILFAARIDPTARTESLDEDSIHALHRAMRKVLEQAIRAHVDAERFPPSFLLSERVVGGKCPRCGRKLQRIKVGGRTTYYCSHDQKRRG